MKGPHTVQKDVLGTVEHVLEDSALKDYTWKDERRGQRPCSGGKQRQYAWTLCTRVWLGDGHLVCVWLRKGCGRGQMGTVPCVAETEVLGAL